MSDPDSVDRPDSAPGPDPRPRPESAAALDALDARVVDCARCPRLVEWRERKAREKRASFDDWDYWGRPVPGFGDPEAWLLAVGLAPAAHGANRTGRMFTGDRSGDWLYGALHRAGFANQPTSERRGDGLELDGVYVTASVRCAPPDNKPKPAERKNCREYLEREVDVLLTGLRVVVPLGGYAYAHVLRIFRDRGWEVPSPMPDFGHGLELEVAPPGEEAGPAGAESGPPGHGGDGSAGDRGRSDLNLNANSFLEPTAPLTVLCSYHPSQQNTFTGTLTREMFDRVWARARELEP